MADVLPVTACLESGWLVSVGTDQVAATVDVRPYGGPDGEDWFIVSDLGCAVGGAGGIGSREEGVVLGVGGASTTLAGITVRTPVSAALDLGTGSGIQALHASRHATRVTATDLNPVPCTSPRSPSRCPARRPQTSARVRSSSRSGMTRRTNSSCPTRRS